MSENKDKENKEEKDKQPIAAPAPSFMSATLTKVDLTYLQFTPPAMLHFECRMLLTDEEKTARQKFFAQPEEAQAAARHAYNVELLSAVVETVPTGFPPDFNEVLSTFNGHEKPVKKAVYIYLIEPTPMNVRVADDAVNLYSQYSQPVEFFR